MKSTGQRKDDAKSKSFISNAERLKEAARIGRVRQTLNGKKMQVSLAKMSWEK